MCKLRNGTPTFVVRKGNLFKSKEQREKKVTEPGAYDDYSVDIFSK